MKSNEYLFVAIIIFLNSNTHCCAQMLPDSVKVGRIPTLSINDTSFISPLLDTLMIVAENSILGDFNIPYYICLSFHNHDSIIHLEARQYQRWMLEHLLRAPRSQGGLHYKDVLVIVLIDNNTLYNTLFNKKKDSIWISFVPKFNVLAHHRKTAITPFLMAKLCDNSITYCVSKVGNGNYKYDDAYIEETLRENYTVEQMSELCCGIYDFSILQKNPVKGERISLHVIKQNTGDYFVHYLSLNSTTVKKRSVRINGSKISDCNLKRKSTFSNHQKHHQ